ncbi:MAG TPA: STAS domain-containing protein [Bacteroidetes bacterium]|nr:STAS domain-containing protein [Bacteroidota bacterium]
MAVVKNHAPGGRRHGQENESSLLVRLFPFLRWFENYNLTKLRADFLAGLTVALVLIPQSMAYAQLADLPAYYGLYAAFLPPLVAALFGSSHQLATGPVAVVSLMTATALEPLATAGSESFIAYAILLALMVGVFQFLLGVFRLGMVVNFLSHPVVNGFTNAAAIIIATSQLSKLFGVDVDKAEHHYQTVWNVIIAAWHHTHWPTLLLALLAFAIMVILKKVNPRIPNVLAAVLVTTLISWATGFEKNITTGLADIEAGRAHRLVEEYNRTLGEIRAAMESRVALSAKLREAQKSADVHSTAVIELEAQAAKLAVEVEKLRERAGDLRAGLRELRFAAVKDPAGGVRFFLPGEVPPEAEVDGVHWRIKVSNRPVDTAAIRLIGGGAVVGSIPRGLPGIKAPKVDLMVLLDLFTMSIIISLLGFMEAISIAKAIAARTGQRLDPNQELIGQGLANIVGSFTSSYPVSGSFSRSAVNMQAGAVTGLSSAFSSFVVLITLLFFTPLLFYLPQSVLAAIIMMAVVGLLNVGGFIHAWRAQKYDGAISLITFASTLVFAPHLDRGILIGVVLSLALFLLRNMKPEMATLSRTPEGAYRDADRWGLEKCRHVAVIRFNDSLFFANVNYLEDRILMMVSSMPELKHVLIVGNGINELDASGEVALSVLVSRLRELGYDVSFSGLNDHVLDVMRRTHLYDKIGEDHLFPSVAYAVQQIHKGSCIGVPDGECPLLKPKFKAYEVAPERLAILKKASPWFRGGEEAGKS